MSQDLEHKEIQEQRANAIDDFDAGFAIETDDAANKQADTSVSADTHRAPGENVPVEAEAKPPAYALPETHSSDVSLFAQDGYTAPEQAASQGEGQQKPAPVLQQVPENIRGEFESLKKLSAAAANLAMEDSPEGDAVRTRLEQYGAEVAQDRAERVLWQRNQVQERQYADAQRAEAAVKAHNTSFMTTLQREHPAYAAMIADPNRKIEAAQYQQEVLSWIGAKPYVEAAIMMQTARHGRDPAEVSALLKKFESERGKASDRPDPTGALAVPSRGAPVVPSGIGDKDDFDAGWNINPSK